MKVWKHNGVVMAGVLALVIVLTAGCGSSNSTLGITISPNQVTILVTGTQLFTATVTGINTSTVTWGVSSGPATTNVTPITGGNSTLGTITPTGLYTAPTTVPNPTTVTIWATSVVDLTVTATATVTIDSGVRVTVIPATQTCTNPLPVTIALETSNTYQLAACVTGTANQGVTWAVNKIAGGDAATVGTISSSGLYTAPTIANSSITITATSVADPNASGNITLTVASLADPTIASVLPSTVPLGSVQQEIYITGTNFFSTSTVLFNGSSNFVSTTYISSTRLRAQIVAPAFSSVGIFPISVQQQGTPSASTSLNLNVQATRPGLISAIPSTVPQNTTSPSVLITGGYLTSQTQATFNGQQQFTTTQATDPRHLTVNLSASPAFATPGLYPLVLQNLGVPAGSPSIAATNVAVSSLAGGIPTAPSATVPLAAGSGPTAVAINIATDTVVVANTASNSISLVNLNSPPTTAPPAIAVGTQPTGVAVDDILNLALVVNSGSNTVSVVNLATGAVTSTIQLAAYTPTGVDVAPIVPVAVGINPLTHRALVVNTSTNTSTVIDLVNPNYNSSPPCTTAPCVVSTVGGSANPISTGTSPQIAIDPILNWAIVTPGGSGAVSIVDLGRAPSPGDSGRLPILIASYSLSTTAAGIAVNPQTQQAFLTDPNATSATLFSELDQTTQSATLFKGETGAAVNPLTNIGVTVNTLGGVAHIVDLNTQQLLQTITVGTSPTAVAVDPGTNSAVVVNQGSNTLSILGLGAIRPLQVAEASPNLTFTSSVPLTMTVTGDGFLAGSSVRLDQVPLTTTTVTASCNTSGICRQLQATIPASMLSMVRRYVVDVQNPDATVSNVEELAVIQPIGVGSTPQAVAVDRVRELAVVVNQGNCQTPGSVSVVNLLTQMAAPPISVGACPFDAAINLSTGQAMVTNNAENTISTVDIVNNVVVSTASVCSACTEPEGLAMDQDTQTAVVTGFQSNTVSSYSSGTSGTEITTVDEGPVAVDVDPTLNYALVATDYVPSAVDLVNLSTNTLLGRISTFQLPTGVVFDPVANLFVVADSEQNAVYFVDPLTLLATNFRIGINPSSLDINPQTSTLVTANSSSNTLSVADYLGQHTRAVMDLGGSPQFGVAIDPLTNIAVVVDQANNRVLLVPLPQ